MSYHDKAVAEQQIRELQQNFTHAQTKEKKALEAKIASDAQVAELEAKVTDLEAQLTSSTEENKKVVADALERGRVDSFSAGHLAGKTEGLNEGRKAYLQSEEYQKSISETRLQGAQDFLKAPAFKMADQLDPSLDAIQPYVEENVAEFAGPDEFEALVPDVGNLP
ncbi:hypothetical protein Salat_0195600 [Sesamum alatum]|uniref:Uncharacterized protein n=1 Tax=Sesamum alatum TaxID=300844 RepID=A0AAE1YYG0_9LAMI|nr:hypothetical protein Salat_0195600 [Sesamum alatum]